MPFTRRNMLAFSAAGAVATAASAANAATFGTSRALQFAFTCRHGGARGALSLNVSMRRKV
jgi:hypothetical protein